MTAWIRRKLGLESNAESLQRIAVLEAKIQVMELQNELLGELNEGMRRWLVAHTAAAAQLARDLGLVDREKR